MPAKIVQVTDIPRTKSGKIVELAVRNVVHGLDVRNLEALANPEALEQYRDRVELKYVDVRMLIDAARSTLLVVDLQEKMVPAIADHEIVVDQRR